MTQEKLAELSGVSRSYISDLECGRKRNITPTKAKALAKALEVDWLDIIADYD